MGKLFNIFLLFFFFFSCKNETPVSTIEKSRIDFARRINDQILDSRLKLNLLDSILDITPPTSKDTFLLWATFKKSNLLFVMGEKDSVITYDKLLYKDALETNNTKYLALSSATLGYDFNQIQKFDSAYYYYNKSKHYYQELGDSSKVGRRLISLAQIQKDYRDYYGAKETLTQAFLTLESSNDLRQMARANDLMGTLNRKLLNFQDAIQFHKKAIKISTNALSETGYKNNLALAYRDAGNYPKAILTWKELIQNSILDKKSERYARILHNLTYVQWKNGKREVEENFLHALHLRKYAEDLRGLISSYTTMAEFYSSKKPRLSKRYIDTLIVVAKQLKMPSGEIDALKLWMFLEKDNVEIRNRLIFLSDSLAQQELKVKTQFAHMRYMDQQEKARLSALETETAERRAQVAEQKTQKTLFLSLSGLLLLGGTSLFFVLRQRHKKEKLKEVYNTEKRISQELHDDLGSSLFGLMTKIQSKEAVDEELLLTQLDVIYNQTRSISHEHSAIDTGPGFASELKRLFNSYRTNDRNIVLKGFDKIDWEHFNEDKCFVLHRTFKELLTNFLKHSKASMASFQFSSKNQKTTIVYADNGIGFNTTFKEGMGLKNIKSRIASVGGSIKMRNGVNKGISIEIMV